jgi:hypothetical protein
MVKAVEQAAALTSAFVGMLPAAAPRLMSVVRLRNDERGDKTWLAE